MKNFNLVDVRLQEQNWEAQEEETIDFLIKQFSSIMQNSKLKT
jgi:hypothetical protein